MAIVTKYLLVFFLMTTLAACGGSSHTQQAINGHSKTEKEHTISVSFNFDTGSGIDKPVSGFRLYKEGTLICESTDPNSTRIDCAFTSRGGTFQFTMTTYFEDGSESIHSEPFTYTIP